MIQESEELEQLRQYFNKLSLQQKVEWIEALPANTFRYLRYCTYIFLYDKQIIPHSDDYFYYILLGGRGSGKTKTLATEVKFRAMRGDEGLMVVSPTYGDMMDIMVPAILDEFPADSPAVYKTAGKIILCPNGNEIIMKSSEQGIIKGRNTSTCFIDELSECWANLGDPTKQLRYWRILDGNIRKGGAQMIITANPETTPVFRHLWDMHLSDPKSCRVVSSSIHDNPYLNPEKRAKYVAQWKGTRYEKLQLDGVLDWSCDGALWTKELIDSTRRLSYPNASFQENVQQAANMATDSRGNKLFIGNDPFALFLFYVIAIDPANSTSENSDETGIIISGYGRDHHIYILEDLSGKYLPDDIAEIVLNARRQYFNAKVLVETNSGGHWITSCLTAREKNLIVSKRPEEGGDIISISVSDSKMTRAQHICTLWDQKTAHIVGSLPHLENQMQFYNGEVNQKSPDRFDAMVMTVQYLAFELIHQPKINLPRF